MRLFSGTSFNGYPFESWTQSNAILKVKDNNKSMLVQSIRIMISYNFRSYLRNISSWYYNCTLRFQMLNYLSILLEYLIAHKLCSHCNSPTFLLYLKMRFNWRDWIPYLWYLWGYHVVVVVHFIFHASLLPIFHDLTI